MAFTPATNQVLPSQDTTSQDTTLQDTNGRIYNVLPDSPLGQGGQGEVLRVAEDKYLAIKLAFTRDPQEIQAYQAHVRALRFLPLSPQLRLSMPIAILQDRAGYVMRLLGSMQPLGRLMPNENKDLDNVPLPEWLLHSIGDGDIAKSHKALAQYSATGGLRLRLNLLLQIAELLGTLHAQGLLFADLSPNNVYISKGATPEVWLIDVDNICYEDSNQSHFYTPKYGAPELVLGQGINSQNSDAFSFALLAFELLTMLKPFEGKAADSADFEENAGIEFSWILDPNDHSNNVAPSELMMLPFFLSRPLFDLFAQTFEDGKTKPSLRPPLWLWRYALSSTLDVTVQCPHCGMSWVFTEHPDSLTCPFCDAQLLLLTAQCHGSLLYVHECVQEPFYLPTRLFTPVNTMADTPCLQVTLLENQHLRFALCDVKREFIWAFAGQGQHALNSVVSEFAVPLQALQEHELILQCTTDLIWQVSFTVMGSA